MSSAANATGTKAAAGAQGDTKADTSAGADGADAGAAKNEPSAIGGTDSPKSSGDAGQAPATAPSDAQCGRESTDITLSLGMLIAILAVAALGIGGGGYFLGRRRQRY